MPVLRSVLFSPTCRCFTAAALVIFGVVPSEAVISLESADPQYHASTPGDNSGWQYEGHFHGYLGVPISRYHFITAKHVGGTIGMPLTLHGDSYVTIDYTDHPTADLRIWEVEGAKPFPTFAPLSSGSADLSATATIFGRGTQRGDPVTVDGEPKGWKWGESSDTKRWGRNLVEGSVSVSGYGDALFCKFDDSGIPGECHLSVGDSGGGLFVMEDGLWRLAGVNLSVDGPFNTTESGTGFDAALFDCGGLYVEDPPGNWVWETDTTADKPSRFYSTRISTYSAWILSETGESGALASENFASWKHWYFTPAQRSDPLISGPDADWDGDGISNLMEFALNLDPIFNERPQMTPASGTRGLPSVSVVLSHLTIEFVRRTSAGGGDLSYVPQFSSNLVDWEDAGVESVSRLNTRWERVVFTDAAINPSPRFVRLKVLHNP